MIGRKLFFLFIILFIIFLIPGSVADIGSDDNFKIEKESGKYWAILAGVDHYVFLQNNNLKYSWDDTFDMKNMLINDCKIEPDHLVFLYDGQATKSGIQTAISTLRSRVGPSDTVIFYFTGHGDQAEDIPPYDEYDDLDEYLCPQDSLPTSYSNDIRDDEIQIWLEQLNVKNIVCIFDICYAGGMVKSASSNNNDEFIGSDYEKDIKNRNFVVLMASNDYEESFSYDSIQNSAFTYYIVEGFKSPTLDINHDYWISAEEVFSYAGFKTTEFTSSASNPQIFDGDTSNDVGIRFLGYPTTIPTTVPTTIPTTVPTTIPTTVPTTIPTTVPSTIPTTRTISPTPTPTSSNLKAEFVASPVSGSAPLRVQFKDTSQGNPSEWYWDINNDAFQDYSGSTIEHVYDKPGDYSIRLVVRNGQEMNSVEKINLIHVTDPEATKIQLYPGWNFISIPGTLEEGYNTAGYVFSGIESDQHSQFRYTALSSAWVRIQPTDILGPSDGIWIYSVNSNTIQLKLEDNPENGLKQVYPGWNAIGISGETPLPVKEALTNVRNQWSTVWGYDASSQKYEAAIINGGTGIHSDTQTMCPTKGYWVYMTGQGTL
jgi:PKD repeat protein